MRLCIHYYGPAKTWASAQKETIAIVENMTLDELKELLVKRHTMMEPYIQKVAFALNGKLVVEKTVLKDGDEIAVLPPVSGGKGNGFLLTEKTIDLSSLLSSYFTGSYGALLPFVGIVRKKEEGKLIEALEYEAYLPLARQKGEKVVEELKERYKLKELHIVHRLGRVKPGEIATVVLAAGEHREGVFLGVRDAVEQIKRRLPIWKKIIFKSQREVWKVGLPLKWRS